MLTAPLNATTQFGYACNTINTSLYSVEMKQLYAAILILSVIVCTVWFDAIIVFLLSGFVPGINIVLAPSTMLAVMIASTVLVISLRKYRVVYQYCLSFYDEFIGTDTKDPQETKEKSDRPRRRYQEL